MVIVVASCTLPPTSAGTAGSVDVSTEILTQVPMQYVNEHLKLELPSTDEQPPDSAVSNLLLKNISHYSIEFPPNYGLRIFALEEDDVTWRSVDNTIEYLGDRETLVPNQGSNSNWLTIVPIAPENYRLDGKGRVRVVVTGVIASTEELNGVRTGAFIDVRAEDLSR